MALSTLSLFSEWRDYYGDWSALVEPYVAALELSKCHAPRVALIPDVQHQLIPASGKIEYNFHLVAGSLIWGILPPADSTDVIQLTDVNMGHAFFQDPVTASFLVTPGPQFGRFPSYTLLPTPHPVVGEGLFTLEVWGTPGDTFFMLLGVGEVIDCPVR